MQKICDCISENDECKDDGCDKCIREFAKKIVERSTELDKQINDGIIQNSNDDYYLNVGDNVKNMITGEEYKIILIDREDGVVVGENEREKRAFGKMLTYEISCLTKLKK